MEGVNYEEPKDNLDKNQILNSISKVVVPKKKKSHKRTQVDKLTFRCMICDSQYIMSRKNADGSFELPQQVCPHVTLTKIEMIKV